MTRDEIIDLANNAGINFQRHTGALGRVNLSTCGSQSIEKVEHFAALVAAAERNRIARAALTHAPSGDAERKSCGSCKYWIDKRRIGDKEGSGSCDRIPMQWQAEPGDALAFVTDGELYFAQLRTMPSFCCAHYEAITPSAESSSTSPAGHAAAQTASDPP